MSELEKTEPASAATRTGPGDGSPGSKPTKANDTAARRFVVVCPRDDGGRRIFGRYATRAQAEHFASALRRIGCHADIEERCEERPEFGSSRRAFLIAALMAGWIKRERVTERVVAELEEETHVGAR